MPRGESGLLTPPALALDTTTQPEDMADLRDGSWSKRHLMQFLARQEKTLVIVPLEQYEAERPDMVHVKEVGYMGHFFSVRKGSAELVPVQIAAILAQSQDPYPTQQSRLRKREITDIRQLPDNPYGLGKAGVEVVLDR